MTQRKYREVTEDDIGKQIEVTDERHAKWHKRTLCKINPSTRFPFETKTGAVWRYARIEATNDPT